MPIKEECVIEAFAEYPSLGRIVMRQDMGCIHEEYTIFMAIGIVKEVQKEGDSLFLL